jgi:WD40 repeat protein
MEFTFNAFVTGIAEDRGGAVFGLGDGTVRWDHGAVIEAHDGAILRMAAHPSGEGVITGGDDGRLVWSRPGGAARLDEVKLGWIDALAVSPASGLIAYGSGKIVTVLSESETGFTRRFVHPASVSDLAFDAKGRRLAAATYGGVALWYARIADQQPVMLRWAGPHARVVFSPDGRFVVSALQEPALHVWRLADGKEGRMEGAYQTKVQSLAFAQGGDWLASSGSERAVLWPFIGKDGPMGRQALDMSLAERGTITRAAAKGDDLILGLDTGKILALNLATDRQLRAKSNGGPPISALAILSDGRIAWGDEAGGAGVLNPA